MGAGTVVYQIKLLSVGVPVVPLLIQLSINAPGKVGDDAQVLAAPVST